MRRYFLALVMAAVAAPAAAQPTPWSPERMTAGWIFTPSIVFGGLYDTNPTLRQTFNPRTPESVALFNPRSEIDFNGQRAKFSAGYSGTLEAYRNLAELTRYEQRGRMDARYQMTPRLLFQTRQQLTLVPTTDQLELEGLRFTRVGSRMLTSWGGFTYDLTQRFSVKTEYMFQWVTFERGTGLQDFQFLQGGYAHSPTVDATYALSRRVKVGAVYVFRHTVIDAGEEISNAHRGQGTLEVQATRTTTLRGRYGVDRIAVVDSLQTRSGPSYGGGISQRIGRVAVIDASYERSFVPSFGFGALQASRVMHAGITMPFAQGRVIANAGITRRRTDPVVLQNILVQLDSYWTNATLGYYVARWLRMEGFVQINQQYSSAQGDVERTRAGIQFVTSKPVRIQ